VPWRCRHRMPGYCWKRFASPSSRHR
jgi:hypothetical protein